MAAASLVHAGDVVTLDASQSTDPQGRALAYQWSFVARPAGSHTDLVDPTSVKSTFRTDAAGEYKVQLIVTNSVLPSAPAVISITASTCSQNPPIIHWISGSVPNPHIGTNLQLSAQVDDQDNTDACGNLGETFTYKWSLANAPAGSTARVNDPALINPTIRTDLAGDYTVQLVVTDSTNLSSAPGTATLHVSNCDGVISATASVQPNNVAPFTPVALLAVPADGDSTCGTPANVTYQWQIKSKPGGSTAVLSSQVGPNPSFVPDAAGFYQFAVQATNEVGITSAPGYVVLQVTSCGEIAPSVDQINIVSGGVMGTQLKLAANSITDANCLATPGAYTYSWKLISEPPASKTLLDDPYAASATLTPDLAGAYQLQLTVANSKGKVSAPVFKTVNVTPCGVAALTWPANAVTISNTSPRLGTLVTFTPAAVDPNTCGVVPVTTSYRWSILNSPPGSKAQLSSTTDQVPSFIPDLNGSYQFSVVASDSLGNTSPVQYFTLTTSTCGQNPPVIASLASTVASPRIGSLVQFTAVVTDADTSSACGNLVETFAYQWSLIQAPAGSSARLNNPVLTNPSLTTDAAGPYIVQLVVTDSTGLSSAPMTLTFVASDCSGALNLAASVTPNSVPQYTQVALLATPSDPDPACPAPQNVTYGWQIRSKPAGSSAVISNRLSPAPTFTPDVTGFYEFQANATNDAGISSAPAFTVLQVASCDQLTPFVDAIKVVSGTTMGSTFQVAANNITDLNCVASRGVYTYSWTLTSPPGSKAVLFNQTSVAPTFVPDQAGNYQVSLTVTDSVGKTSTPVFKTIAAAPCGVAALTWPTTGSAVDFLVVDPQPLPVIRPAAPVLVDTQIHVGGTVTLVPHAADPNTCGLIPVSTSYRWSMISRPAGSRTVLSSATDTQPSFIPDVVGSYQLVVVATDSLGNNSPVQPVTVTTSNCGQNPVTVQVAPAGSSAASPTPVNSFQALALSLVNGTASSGDNQGNPSLPLYCPSRFATTFTYAWAVVNQPAGGTGTLSNLSGTSSVFQSTVPGPYAVTVEANASNGLSSAPSTEYIGVSACGSSAPVIQSTATTTLVNGVPTPTPRPPVGTTVTLTANGVSPDSINGCGLTPAISYTWTLASTPTGSGVSSASQNGTGTFNFTPDFAGTYVFSVVAKDSHGLVSSPVTITVPTGACGPSVPAFTFSQAGTAQVGNLVTVTAPAGVTDACVPNATFTYAWQFASRPAASSTTLDTQVGSPVHFTPDVAGDYAMTLTVTDNGGFSTQVTKVLHQGPCTAAPVLAAPTFTSPTPPIVYRGDQISVSVPGITPGSCGSLTSTSYTYSWALVSKPVGSATTLSSTTATSPGFVADVAGGTYQLAVQVKDGLGNVSAPAFVSVPVSACGSQKPSVTVNPTSVSQKSYSAATIVATATSGDNQNDPTKANYCPAQFAKTLSYQWQVASAPVGAQFSLGGATTASAVFAPSTNGAYQLGLVVTDSSGLTSLPVTVPVTVSCADQTPAAVDAGTTPAFQATQVMANIAQIPAGGGAAASAPLSIVSSTLKAGAVKFYTGTTVKLQANAVDANFTCGFTPATLQYKWTFTSVPTGSQPSFDSSTSPTPSFVPDVPGDYFIQLDLVDSAGKANTQVFTLPGAGGAVVSVGSCGKQTPTSLIGLQQPASPAPTANIGSVNGFAVILDGSKSYSPDNAPVDFSQPSAPGCGLNRTLGYNWAFVSLPSGAQGTTFNDPTRVNPAFTPTTSGSYVISLAVSDGFRTSQATTVSVVTADGAVGTLDYVAPQGSSVLPAGLHHYNTFRIPAGATVYLDPANAGVGVMDLVVSGDVYIGGTLNLSGSPGSVGPSGDVSWIGSSGGDTAYPLSNHGTPAPGGSCPTYATLSRSLGGNGGLGADGAGTAGCANTPALGGYGGGMGGGQSGGGGGGFAGGGGGGGNTCGGNTPGGAGAGTYGGAGGPIAQGGVGGNGGGAPYSGVTPANLVPGDCGNSGYGGGGGGGSIGLDAAQDVSMASSLRAGSGGGGGAGDEGRGGGGGGGAVRIRSNSSITVSGQILAQGGHGGDSGGDPYCCQGGSGGGGSGGAIWLGAPVVYTTGTVSATGGRGGLGQSSRGGGGAAAGGAGGLGRIRISSPKLTNYGILQPSLPPNGVNASGYAYVTSTYP